MSGRTLNVVMTAYYLLLVGVILWSLSDTPTGPRVWYYTMRGCQNLARFFGEMGMQAEIEYHHSVEGSRL